jgi:hypothetical protein
MRTILALATAVLLFAPGCGSNSTTPPDMQITPVDMAVATGADMTMADCKAGLMCAQGCLQKADILGCANTCAAALPATAQQQFGAVVACLKQFCVLDASRLMIGQCFSGALASTSMCASQYSMCM